jgi:hypothetical protein
MALPAAHIRSLYRRHAQAHEAVFHFAAPSRTGPGTRDLTETQPAELKPCSSADKRFRAALRRELLRAGLA